MISDESYPKKTITAVLLILFVPGINWNLQKFIDQSIDNFPYQLWFVSEYSMHLCEKLFLLCMTLFFYYLADFGHKPKNSN